MEDKDYRNTQQLVLAFRALDRSVEKSLLSGIGVEAVAVAVQSYRRLHERAGHMMPEDYFITEVLALPDDISAASDETQLAQLHMLATQAIEYLEGLARMQRRAAAEDSAAEPDDMRRLGRDLQEQIVSLTRATLRRALSNIDIDLKVDVGRPGAPPEPPSEPEERPGR